MSFACVWQGTIKITKVSFGSDERADMESVTADSRIMTNMTPKGYVTNT